MSFATQISNLITRLGTEFKAVRSDYNGKIGDLSTLQTTSKVITGALNELKSATASAAGVDDTTASTSKAYSSSKTDAQIAAAKAALKSELVNGAGAALDTFKEVADQLAADESAAAALTTAVGNRVRVDVATQSLTTTQQGNARTNISAAASADLGDPATDFVAQFNTAIS